MTLRALTLAILVATAPLTTTLSAQERAQPDTLPVPISIGMRMSLYSATLGERRTVQIHLPRSYAQSKGTVYPVLYLLDGGAHFRAVTAMVDYLAVVSRAPEMIVVGIPNGRDRTHDLTPPADTGVTRVVISASDTVDQRFPTAGGAAKMRAFLTTELAPWVEARYRAAPYRVLVGHSFGGLFVVDALSADPRAFNAYVAISPSLSWDKGRYLQRVVNELRAAPIDGRALYMTTGELEGSDMIEPAKVLAAALETRRAPGFRSWYRVMPGETHGSNPFRTEYDAFERIFQGWEPPEAIVIAATFHGDVSALDAHHTAVSARFGIPWPLTPDEVNQMAYFNLGEKKLDVAMRLLRWNVEKTPQYANGWDSLAEGLEAQGKMSEALAAQERAVSLATAQGDPLLSEMQAHLDRLRKLVAR